MVADGWTNDDLCAIVPACLPTYLPTCTHYTQSTLPPPILIRYIVILSSPVNKVIGYGLGRLGFDTRNARKYFFLPSHLYWLLLCTEDQA